MFSRNHRSRVTVARGSALEMEFKRGRFRLSVFSDPPEDTELQRKLDHEIRMREGACKLLAACSQREQALEATKSLLVCNSRILSYMGELQRRKEAQVLGKTGRRPSDSVPPPERSPCRGRVCISDLRIPLMWKDTEYFKNKGDLHRWAVFLLLQLGEQIQDTEMVLVDRTLPDISFQNNVLFAEAGPDFELRLELYGACVEEEGALAGAPKRLATKLSSSLGRSSGKRVRASLDSAGGSGNSPILLPTPAVGGPRYHLLAHTTLTLAAVQDGFRTHDLTLASHEENPAWLPLYGSVCCRLAAQPLCMTQPTASGTLRVQQVGELRNGTLVHGVLKGTKLFCYWRSEEADTGQEPLFTIAINKETRVRAGELEQAPEWPFTLSISNRYGGDEVTNTLRVESRDALHYWMEALWQLFFDMTQWKHCCDDVMKIEIPAPRKPPQALAKQGSLYHEMAIEPLDDIAAVTDILAQREGTRLEPPPSWLAMFTDQPALPSSCSPASVAPVPTWTQPLPWGRPRTFSLDAAPSDRSLGASRSVAPLPAQRSPQSRGFYSKSQLRTWLQSPV
ncbi:rhotekin isoform X1 [Phodopus roborovskii]|uniref:Rtkn protein n=1 Tax=Phodopus roborovskii TaxID=109678 RepID=A0AAV0A2C0_PHORO|nr:rhotekin isoform X1 [Phodopus roborovskii]CAH7133241.1 Rtkn [Phodopus roborovskii]